MFLKNEGKEVERESKKGRGRGEGLPLNIFLGVEILSSGVKKFSGGEGWEIFWGVEKFFFGGGGGVGWDFFFWGGGWEIFQGDIVQPGQ